MKTITITHPTLNISITEEVSRRTTHSAKEIKARWKQRYGKLYDRCTVTMSYNRMVRKIQIERPEPIYSNRNFNAA